METHVLDGPLPKVLIVTGGLLSVKDRSFALALRKQIAAVRASSAPWLDIQLKVAAAEHLLAQRRYLQSAKCRSAAYHTAVERFFSDRTGFDTPELTEVVLATLLEAQGVDWRAVTFSDLHADPALRERLMAEVGCVFVSSTLLRDLSELAPMVQLCKRRGNHVVVGGALANLIWQGWKKNPNVDLLAVGYGELLVPVIVDWMRNGYRELRSPPGGRLESVGDTPVLVSGLPPGHDLDIYPTPDWRLAQRNHGRSFSMVHYESMRGCSHRCAFCSYPYLFSDHILRYKSAGRIAEDWLGYAAQGVEFVTCLDSNFTSLKPRLMELCQRLIDRGSAIKWICYARDDDLADLDVCRMMRRAGCLQVQIGVESGNAQIRKNMNKKSVAEDSYLALQNCRKAGISTLVTVIIGFPGETAATVRDSLELIRSAAPDFAYGSPFTTRIEKLPVLNPENRARFGLRTAGGRHSSSPYWRHDTMSCEEMVYWQQWFTRRLMLEKIALDGTQFYQGLLRYRLEDRPALLDFQYDMARSNPALRTLIRAVGLFTGRRLRRDVDLQLSQGEGSAAESSLS